MNNIFFLLPALMLISFTEAPGKTETGIEIIFFEGKWLAQKFGVSGYHALLLTDKNENHLLTSEGYYNADNIIKLIKSSVK